MLTKERPHLLRRVDAVAIPPDHPFRRYPLAARPLMAFSLVRVEHHACIVSAVRVLEARDISSDRRFDRIRSAPVSRRPIRIKPGTLGNVAPASLDQPPLYRQIG